MNQYENGAVLLQNGTVLEEEEIDLYAELEKEILKLQKNIEGLGRQALPEGTNEQIREKGLEILKSQYGPAYDKLVKKIGGLANDFIKGYCFNLLFYKDAADSMLVSPTEIITGYIKDKKPDIRKAVFTDYSVDEFTKVVGEIREKVTALAILNWQKHQELNRRK